MFQEKRSGQMLRSGTDLSNAETKSPVRAKGKLNREQPTAIRTAHKQIRKVKSIALPDKLARVITGLLTSGGRRRADQSLLLRGEGSELQQVFQPAVALAENCLFLRVPSA
jgi:hypothetical protein